MASKAGSQLPVSSSKDSTSTTVLTDAVITKTPALLLECSQKEIKLSRTLLIMGSIESLHRVHRLEQEKKNLSLPTHISYTRFVQKVSSHVIKKQTFIKEDTRYKKHCTQDNDASVPFKVGTLGPHTVLPVTSAALLCFPESCRSEISSLSKVFQFWEKLEVTGHDIWAVGGLSHLGDLIFCQKLFRRCDE